MRSGSSLCVHSQLQDAKNVITGWNEHENPKEDSEPTKHLFQQPDNVYQSNVLMSVPMNICKRKNQEAFFIAAKHPTLIK